MGNHAFITPELSSNNRSPGIPPEWHVKEIGDEMVSLNTLGTHISSAPPAHAQPSVQPHGQQDSQCQVTFVF